MRLIHIKLFRRAFLVALSFMVAARMTAQPKVSDFNSFQPRFEVFTLPGGTEANAVQQVVQDSLGFLWFASKKGLYRFDGIQFITYRHNPLDSTSIADDYVEWVMADSKGILWLGYWGAGVSAFDPETETCVHYRPNPEDPDALSDGSVSMIVEDREGFIWVGTKEGLNRLDRQTGKFRRFLHNPTDPRSLSYNFVRSLYVDKEGTLWAGCGTLWDPNDLAGKLGGLNRYNRDGTFTRYLHDPEDPASLADNRVRAIFEDSRGNFWIGTPGPGLHKMDRRAGTFTSFPFDPRRPSRLAGPALVRTTPTTPALHHVTFIFEDQKGRLWIGAPEGGLNIYDPVSDQVRHFEAARGMTDSLQSNYLWNICQSNDGAIILVTGSGSSIVYRIKNEETLFPLYDLRPVTGSGNISFSAIMEDDAGYLWMITRDAFEGVLRLDRKTWKCQRFSFRPAIKKSPIADFDHLGTDPQGNIWAQTTENGLYTLDPKEKDPKNLFFRPDSRFLPRIRKDVPDTTLTVALPFFDRDGRVWIGTWGYGLYLFDNAGKLIAHFTHNPKDPHSIASNQVTCVLQDRQGRIWVHGGGGTGIAYDQANPLFIDRFDPGPTTGTGRFGHLFKAQERGGAVKIIEDKKGFLWFLPFGGNGIGKIDPATGEYHFLPTGGADIQMAKDGQIWILGNGYLAGLDPETETIRTFTSMHGVQTSGWDWRIGSWVSRSGEIFYSGKGGFHAFYPHEVEQQLKNGSPLIRITNLTVMSRRVVPGRSGIIRNSVWETRMIRLPYNRNWFSFSVSHFSYSSPDNIQIHFRLENYDPDWRKDLAGGEASYVNVPPGRYIFRVRATNAEGVWDRETSMGVVILPPWWRTWWAYLIYAVTAVSAIRGFIYWRIAETNKKLAAEQRINEATSRFVPNEFLRALGRTNITEVMLGDHIQREVTVLFSDIRDYTTLSETMTPEDNFRFVNSYNGRMGPIIDQNNGFINQYFGDGIMAIFPGSPADALRAAIDMQRAIAIYNEERKLRGHIPIRIGIGMHTGSLIMGIIGDKKRMDATTISDTVNTASRIESLSKFYQSQILLSGESLGQIENPSVFHFRFLGQVQVKGKRHVVRVYECFDSDAPATRYQKLETLSDFEEGLQHYHQEEFAEAILKFKAVLSKNPADRPALLFLNRSVRFVDEGVPPEWSGVEMMEEK